MGDDININDASERELRDKTNLVMVRRRHGLEFIAIFKKEHKKQSLIILPI